MDGRVSPCDQWLDKATAGIRFGPDRRAVSEELAAHLEDKAAGLRRIFPDMTEEEVWERATSEMGDPAEIGKALARLHKPWLGYLWRASKWGAAILVVLLMAINLFLSDHFQSYGYALWGRESTVYGRTEGEKIQMGGYTFQIVGAACLDYPQDWRESRDRVQVAFRVSTPRFWERIDEGALQSALTMTGPGDWSYGMDRALLEQDPETMSDRMICGLQRAEWGLFHDTYTAYGDVEWTEGESICLKFHFGKGSFTLTVDDLQRVVME